MPPIPENSRSGNACVIWAILASDSGRIAGPPMPPDETKPSTLTSGSSVSGSNGGIDGKVLDDTMASAPPRNVASASSTMLAVAGVSLTHTGTVATALTAWVDTEHSTGSLPTLAPMSTRSMWGHEKLSSIASAPASWTPSTRVCQLASSLSLPEPAMIEATRIRSGQARLIEAILGSHQSIGLSEISSQFQDATRVVSGRLAIDTREPLLSARMNFVLGPATLTTGWRPMVLVTTPPQPASYARRMLLSDSVGGADASRNGFSKRRPVNTVDRSATGRILLAQRGMR